MQAAIVTGVSRGLGAALASELLERGFTVLGIGRASNPALKGASYAFVRFDLAEAGTDMPFDEAGAIGFAARFGVDEPAFQHLPDAAKYASGWRNPHSAPRGGRGTCRWRHR